MGILEEQEIHRTILVCSECGNEASPVIVKKYPSEKYRNESDEPWEITYCSKCRCGIEGIQKLDGKFEILPC